MPRGASARPDNPRGERVIAAQNVAEREREEIRRFALGGFAPGLEGLPVHDRLGQPLVEEGEQRVLVGEHVALSSLVAKSRHFRQKLAIFALEGAGARVLAADQRVFDEDQPSSTRSDGRVVDALPRTTGKPKNVACSLTEARADFSDQCGSE